MRNLIRFVFASAVLALAAIGCTYNGDPKPQATTRPTPAEQAAKDPAFKHNAVNTDISGGGVSNLNRDALKRDWDSFLLK
jgi:hypothetical protein